MLGNKGGLLDYLDLILFRLAKIGRKPLEKSAELEAFYEEFFTDNEDKVFNSGCDRRKAYKGCVLDRVSRQYVPADGTVIDIGCGVGDNLKSVQRDRVRFKGLEYSANNLARAKLV